LKEKMIERVHWFKDLKGVNWVRLIGLFVFAKVVSGFFYLDALWRVLWGFFGLVWG
jgi:hypothetical protein